MLRDFTFDMMSSVVHLEHTWITRVAVSAHIIARGVLHEILQGLFVPRLLALAHDTRHGGGS
ncbi:hypothetical protein LB505_005147 [Fusarium chuoi]|nr:hypothetical protein LB505_005147 [Fusarium chuoi]